MTDTVQLLIVAAGWTVISALIAHLIPSWPARIALIVVLVGVPFWELPYGYLHFRKLCSEQGAFRSYEPFAPQETVCADYPVDSSASFLLNKGFKAVEGRDKNNRVKMITKDVSFQEANIGPTKIASSFCIRQNFVRGLPWRIQRNEYVVVAEKDRRVVARHSDFVWFGMWWQQEFAPVLGRGGECRHPDPLMTVASALLLGSK